MNPPTRWRNLALDALAIASSVANGFALWATSPWWSGHTEPWDGSIPLYIAAVTLGALIAAISPRVCLAVPIGLVLGQVSYILAMLPGGPLMALGMVFLLYYAIPSFAVAAALGAGLLIYRYKHPRPHRHECPHCGYDLAGLAPGAPCPECGRP